MKKFFVSGLVFSLLLLAGCSVPQSNSEKANQTQNSYPLKIVASFYPLYEIAQKVGGNKKFVRSAPSPDLLSSSSGRDSGLPSDRLVQVYNLVPTGTEPHDYEPSPQDVIRLQEADLVLINGAGLEPWADKIIPELKQKGVQVLNQSELFDDASGDPHFWLDPFHYRREIRAVTEKLEFMDPPNKEYYQKNADEFIQQLVVLDENFQNGLKNCTSNIIVTSHAAFGYLAQRYDLEMVSVSGLSPEAEPSPQALANVIKIIRDKKVKAIFTETLLSPKVAETIARETEVQVLVLNPLEGLTDEEIAQGQNYISIMEENLKNLRIGLECG